jgi:hypothetical protein
MARFLVDEDLPRSLAPFLTAAGLSADDVRNRELRDQPDDEVFRHAVAHGFDEDRSRLPRRRLQLRGDRVRRALVAQPLARVLQVDGDDPFPDDLRQ